MWVPCMQISSLCGVGHKSQLERATGLRRWSYELIGERATRLERRALNLRSHVLVPAIAHEQVYLSGAEVDALHSGLWCRM